MEDKTYQKLGEILISSQKIDFRNLEEAIEKQRVFKRKIGEILIMMGLLTPEELELYLLYQREFCNPESTEIKMDFDLFKKISAGELLLKFRD